MLIRANLILRGARWGGANLWMKHFEAKAIWMIFLNDVSLSSGEADQIWWKKLMLKETECPAGIPASHRLAIETLRKYGLLEVQFLRESKTI